MKPVVFLSYSRKDFPFVRDLYRGLAAAGMEVWFDVLDMSAGENYLERIRSAIERCTHCILIISPYSMASAEVAREIELAESMQKKIVPVLLQAANLPDELRILQWVDFRRRFEIPLQVLANHIRGEKPTVSEDVLLEILPRPLDLKGIAPIGFADCPRVIKLVALLVLVSVLLQFVTAAPLMETVWPVFLIVAISAGVVTWYVFRMIRRQLIWAEAMLTICSCSCGVWMALMPATIWPQGAAFVRWTVGASVVVMVFALAVALWSRGVRRWMVAYPENHGWGPNSFFRRKPVTAPAK